MTEVRENAMTDTLYPTQFKQTKKTSYLEVYCWVHERIKTSLEESEKALSWLIGYTEEKMYPFAQKVIYPVQMWWYINLYL